MPSRPESGAEAGLLAFAQKLLTVLDQGRTTATYKYAVLLGLMDLCLEKTSRQGTAPAMVTTAELADKVVNLYWTQAMPHSQPSVVLRQNSKGQAEILRAIADYRSRPDVVGLLVARQARIADPKGYAGLCTKVEFKLAEMPLPRLQRIGDQVDEFLYRVAFQSPERAVKSPTDLRHDSFDNRILFVGDAGEHLVALAPLLRPLIQREWTALVARFNGFPESALEAFLFGCPRTPTKSLRSGLRDIQDNRCFYCDKPISVPEIDHFVPWARFADDGLDNLVLTDRGCNGSKSAHLAACGHLERWTARFSPDSALNRDLATLAERENWERDRPRTRNVATGIYSRLPAGSRLWKLGDHFEAGEPQRIARALDVAAFGA